VSVCCEPYSPWQKGKIERLNRTLEDELLRGLPRWIASSRQARRAHRRGPVDARVLQRAVRRLRRALQHAARAQRAWGLTPLQAWQSDSTPLQRISVERARWMLKARHEGCW
jgi:hypothetical protein